MKETGLSIVTGCSWIEVKGKVHMFLAGDDHHPRITEITSLDDRQIDEVKSSKARVLFGVINTTPCMPIWVTKNLYMCQSCHKTMNEVQFISKVVWMQVTVRDDSKGFH